MSYIKILRLKTGEDIIGFVELHQKYIKIKYPTTVFIHYDYEEENQELLMKYWLPVSLIEKNEADIPMFDILLILDVKQEFKEYYLNYLGDFTKISESNLSNDEATKKELFEKVLESIDIKSLGKAH